MLVVTGVFWAFGLSGMVVLGDFGVDGDLGGMGRANKRRCSCLGVIMGF